MVNDWTPCGLGVCAAEAGHEGTCAEASGWDEPAICGRRGWTQEDQDFDNPCVCGLDAGHDGLHECYEGCGAEFAGGQPKPGDED